jgi:diguanylate cyclase (GGDEF)-like protein/PAS domain S-box-containing protein
MLPKMRSPLQYFLLLFLPLALVVLASSFAYWTRDAKARLEVIQGREMARILREVQILETVFATRAADAAFLAERVSAEMAHGREPVKNIQELLRSFAEVKRDYLVVRFVDARGMEKARVDTAPEGVSCVPQSRLQDKSRRQAFQQAMALRRSQRHAVHVSQMDLLVEHDRIVEPVKPVLHFSSPVDGPDGGLAGIVVLSLDGNIPLTRLRQAQSTVLGRPLMANTRGYWLLGPSPAQEWGFHFPERERTTIEATWPGTWERMRGQEQGQFVLNGALYSFDTVHPESPGGMNQFISVAPAEGWLILSRVDPEQLQPLQSKAFLAMTGGLLLLLAGFSWLWAQARVRRDQALAELRGSEESARAILNAPQDAAFLLLDLDGRILAANSVSEERFRGVFAQGLVGRSLWEFGVAELIQNRRKLFDFCAATGEPVRFDDTRQGLILDNTFYPVRGSDGVTRRIVIFSRDVTAERAAQQRLQTLSRAVEQSPAVIVITDARGTIEYVNPSFTTRYGYSFEEAVGQNPRILKSGRHDAAFYQQMWATLAEGRDWIGELCNQDKDGHEIWERASISPVLDEAGQVTHYVAVKEDITEQRQVLQALAENEAKIRAMSEASQDGLIMLDDKGLVVFWNRSAEGIFGYSREEMLGRRLHDFVTIGEDAAKADQAFADFSRTGKGSAVGVITEFRTRRKDGTVFPVELSLGAFQLQGRWWAVGTVRDVTERKRAEALLLELATTDGLTGLANRRHFMERGNAELGRARRTGQQVSCIMLDVDHFKKVNDTYGHEAGDLVLKTIARTAREILRSIDVLGRLGGEEFAAVLPETGLEAALLVAERLREAVAGMGLACEGRPLAVTMSLGVAQVLSTEESLDGLLKRADEALYEAKQTGRNRVVASRPSA